MTTFRIQSSRVRLRGAALRSRGAAGLISPTPVVLSIVQETPSPLELEQDGYVEQLLVTVQLTDMVAEAARVDLQIVGEHARVARLPNSAGPHTVVVPRGFADDGLRVWAVGVAADGARGPVVQARVDAAPATPPILTGTQPGEPLTYTPGAWRAGQRIERFLRRDGAAIATLSGSAQSIQTDAGDHGATFQVVEVNSEWEEAAATSESVTLLYAAPTKVGSIPDQSLTVDPTLLAILDAASFFAGDGLSYEATGPVSVDETTGMLTISRATAMTPTTATVTALNRSSAQTHTFTVTVTGTSTGGGTLAAIPVADVEITWRLDPNAGSGGVPADAATWHFTLATVPAGLTHLWWRGTPHVDGHSPATTGYHPAVPHPTLPRTWYARARTASNPAPQLRDFLWVNRTVPTTVGEEKTHHLVYSTSTIAVMPGAASDWSLPTDPIVRVVQLFALPDEPGEPDPEPPVISTGSKRMPRMTQAQANAPGFIHMDGMQYWHSVCGGVGRRRLPGRFYAGQDSSGLWKTLDAGRTWGVADNVGLRSFQTLGVECDPENPGRVFAIMGGSGTLASQHQGLYFSPDGAKNWQARKIAGVTNSNRSTTNAVTWEHGSRRAGIRADRWFAIVGGRSEAGARDVPMGRSTDGGETWTELAWKWSQATYGQAVHLVSDTAVRERFFVSAERGLCVISNAYGTPTIANWNGTRGLPAVGVGVSGPVYVSDDGQTIIVGYGSRGIWRSTNGGTSFTQISTESGFASLWVNPYNPLRMMLHYSESSPQLLYKYSENGGTSFSVPAESDIQKKPGVTERLRLSHQFNATIWLGSSEAFFSCSMKNPRTSAQHMRTANGGRTAQLSSNGFSGHNFASRWGGPFMASWRNKNIIGFSFLDAGLSLTLNGGRWFEDNSLPTGLIRDATGGDHPSIYGVAIHPRWNQRPYAFGASGKQFASRLFGTFDGGASWSHLASESQKTYGVMFDVDNPATVLWGKRRSTNHGQTWSAMTGVPSGDWRVVGCTTGDTRGTAFFALGDDNLQVYRSTNGGTSWTHVLTLDRAPGVPGYSYGALVFHPRDRDIVFSRGPTGNTLTRYDISEGTSPTTRGKTTLTVMPAGSGNLAPLIDAATCDPRFPDVMYARTIAPWGSARVYRSTNGGTSWTAFGPTVLPLSVNYNSLIVMPQTGELICGTSVGTFIVPPPYPQAGQLAAALPHLSYLGT